MPCALCREWPVRWKEEPVTVRVPDNNGVRNLTSFWHEASDGVVNDDGISVAK